MTEYDKIAALLDKENLSSEEKALLNNMLDKDPEALKFSRAYRSLRQLSPGNGHIDEELMGEYILYKNDNSSGRWMAVLSGRIEDHIRRCGECENLFSVLNAEYTETDQFISQSVPQSIPESKTPPEKKAPFYKSLSGVKYAAVSIAAVLLVYLSLNIIYSAAVPEYKRSFMELNDFYTTRGRTSELFQRGIDAIDSRNYDKAVIYLSEDAQKNSGDESIFYTYFILGITYVNKAESNFIGLYKSYNRDDVLKGIESFNRSIALNNSGRFDNLKLDAHYFLGRSYLLMDDEASGKEHLEIVTEGKGSYYREAEEILRNL